MGRRVDERPDAIRGDRDHVVSQDF